MVITPQAVDAYKQLMEDPKTHNLPFKSLKEIFEDAEVATPKHILYKEYIKVVNVDIPKFFFYVVMDEIYGNKIDKAPNGDLGYKLKIKEEE